jgi:hypothetical protein
MKFVHTFCLFILSFSLLAQETIVSGKVTDAGSGDPIPFVNVVFKGTTVGATTDFDGRFTVRLLGKSDSLIASYIGYISKSKRVKIGIKQVINFQLSEAVTNLQEVVVKAGENPAFPILRKVIDNKDKNDKRKLTGYEYDTYSKMELDLDHITEKFREKKVMKKIAQVLDSVQRIAGEDGKPILPLFITESVSKIYYRTDPTLKKEMILKSKISGVGVTDGSTLTQLIGSSLQEYNFYQNWLGILRKEFVSPIADGWRLYYKYDLMDSMMVGDDFCYKIDFYPQSPEQLAFTGTMWITRKEYAIKQIDASVGNQADVNFIDRIRIQQELKATEEGPWLPVKNRVLIDIGELTPNSAGMIAKFYTSNKNFVVGKPQPIGFYERNIEVKEDARMYEEEKYWDTLRHEPLSAVEKNVYKMIDTLKNIPIVKTYTDIVQLIIDGHYKLGKVKLGPYINTFAWNTIEGFRLQFGFKTTYDFSKKWIHTANLAYGFDDERFKYLAQAQHIISTKKWTTLTFRSRYDMMRLGIDDESLLANPLFRTAVRWGIIRRGYYFNEQYIAYQRELFKGFSQKIAFRTRNFEPTYDFGYYENPQDLTQIGRNFNFSEAILEARYARDETFIQNKNERISLGTVKWPVITLRYTHGLKDILNGQFDYDKLYLNISKRIRTGPLGVGQLSLTSEYIFNTLPYPLLAVHQANHSKIYSPVANNLMNFGEFTSDQYVGLNYRQFLEGFLINRLPILHKLKWRVVATTNVIFGDMRKSNRDLISTTTTDGKPALYAGYFTGTPYVEAGYGIENIFHFLRVDFVHRLTYLDRPESRSFGILFTAQVKL